MPHVFKYILVYYRLQVVLDRDKLGSACSRLLPNLTYHSAVRISGTLIESAHPNQEFELVAKSVDFANHINQEGGKGGYSYPVAPRKIYPQDHTREYPHVR